MNRHERRAAAKKTGVSNGPRARTPASFYEAGLRHVRSGQLAEAESCCRQALAINADHADSLHLMGVISLQAQDIDLGVEWIARALRQDAKAEYLSTLGSALRRLGRLEEALKAYDKALMLKPEDAELWKDLGKVLMQAKRPGEAALSFQQALKFDPRLLEAANDGGYLLFDLDRYDEALACFNLADAVRPNHADTAHMRALCLARMRRFDEALVENNRALTLNPNNADTHNNLGTVLQAFGRHDEALVHFDEALTLQPNSILAMNNKAASLSELHRFDESFAAYDRSMAIEPDNAGARWNLALLQMLIGDFESGWIGREWRWKLPALGMVDRKFTQPVWLGNEPIEGKTILLHGDEGLGDSIQFARYAPMVAARGARVIIEVADAVHPLLSGMPGVSQCLPRLAAELPEFDLHCPMSSLPLAFDTRLETIPSAVPYLPVPVEARQLDWESRLGSRDRFRVGLVWSGSRDHQNDHNRSISLPSLSPILDLDAKFVSLQKDVRDQDKTALLERSDIVDLTENLTDFAETAALVSCLDLVISVDTSVAHLAGALGCPVWILLPYTPDFRWLLDRDDSPWYPTARLFRQTETREWASVLERVRADLRRLIASCRPVEEPVHSG
jgi:tetratricopeptide (TPR) repeat protein